MMVIAVGLSSYNIALFHLVNHAFYKALLFLGAGAVIHAVADNQDFRRYGGLRPFLPLTYSVMLIASLSLVAFPFMTGFYSKDFILESAYGQYYLSGTVVYIIATIGAMFTTLYSVKVLYLTFLTNPNGPLINYKQAHEGDIFMSLPLMILAVFSIFFGFLTKDMFIGLGSGFFSDNALFIHPSHEIMLDTEFGVPTLFKLLPLIFTVSLSVIAILLSEYLSTTLIYFKSSRIGYNIFSFFNQRFLIELFYNKYVTGVVLKLGGQTTKVLDKGSVEYIGPYGLEKGILSISNNLAKLNTGVVTTYGLYILIGIVTYVFFSLYIGSSVIILVIVLSFSLSLKRDRKTPLLVSNIIQSSVNPNSQNHNNDSDEDMSHDEDLSHDEGYDSDSEEYMDGEARERNFRDAVRREEVAQEADRLQTTVDTADKLEKGEAVTSSEMESYYKDLQGTDIGSVRHHLGEKYQEVDHLDKKMERRREAECELSEEESSDSDAMDIDEKHSNKPWSLPQNGESSRSNTGSHLNPDVGYPTYTNPAWSIHENSTLHTGGESSGNSGIQATARTEEQSSVNITTQGSMDANEQQSVRSNAQPHEGGNVQITAEDNLQSSVNDGVEQFACLFLFTNYFTLNFLIILYRLHQINFFKFLMFYFKYKI